LENSTQQRTKNKLNYNDIEPIVEYLVKVKSNHHTFDCWDVEDIAQEIRIICLNAMPEFDQSKSVDEKGLLNYLGRSVDNRLQNLKRDNYVRYNQKYENSSITADDQDYSKYKKYKENLQSKLNIKHPVNIDGLLNSPGTSKGEDELIAQDFAEYLLDSIEPSLRASLAQLISGDKECVSIKMRERIQLAIKDIMAEDIVDSGESP
jgi:hypothetical protein